jgi:hypothetical protein
MAFPRGDGARSGATLLARGLHRSHPGGDHASQEKGKNFPSAIHTESHEPPRARLIPASSPTALGLSSRLRHLSVAAPVITLGRALGECAIACDSRQNGTRRTVSPPKTRFRLRCKVSMASPPAKSPRRARTPSDALWMGAARNPLSNEASSGPRSRSAQRSPARPTRGPHGSRRRPGNPELSQKSGAFCHILSRVGTPFIDSTARATLVVNCPSDIPFERERVRRTKIYPKPNSVSGPYCLEFHMRLMPYRDQKARI